MNIFVLDNCFTKNAQYHIDKHVGKMQLEVAQMLCTAHHMTGSGAIYAPAQPNNPVCKWVRETKANYLWTVKYGQFLADEYKFRFGKIHASSYVINWCAEYIPKLPDHPLTSHYLAMPDKYKTSYVIESYRNYYQTKKFDKSGKNMFQWTNREPPEWLNVT